MRWIELRRHAFTKKGDARGRGSHLSQEGVDAARSEANAIGPVAYVGVSESPRTMETAIAMGFAVDDVLGIASTSLSGEVEFHEWWDWPDPWAVYRERIATRPALATFVEGQLAIVIGAIESIGDGETALLIGHGGWIEPTVVAALQGEGIGEWGPPFEHLEGVRLAEQDGAFTLASIRRRVGEAPQLAT